MYRYLKGETAADEELQIAQWLEADPVAHQKEMDAVRFIFEGMELYGGEVPHPRVEPQRRIIAWGNIGRYAIRLAAVVVFALLGGYMVHRQTVRSFNEQTTTLHVPFGQRIEITLADGSNVWLNSGAKIEYPVVFDRNIRKVKLSGEAMFDVRHDDEWPFEVETFATNIRVLGTKFNVDAEETYRKFSTTLLEGKVKISNRLDPQQKEIIMKPNDIVNLSNGRLFVGTTKDREALCWTEGLVNISGLSFRELMAKFEQVFDVRILISRQSLPDMGKVSGKIRVNDGIENALHILQYAADFTYEKNDETNVVTIY